MEMLVAMALLLVLMGLASQVFKITLEGTGRLTQISEIDRSLRMFEERLGRDLAGVDPRRSIMVIQGNPAPAYWTERQKQRDGDGNVLNGIDGQGFALDPLRENPTLGYDVLDERVTSSGANVAPDGSFDWTVNDDFIPRLPRADILMLVSNLPDERSKVAPEITSDGPVMVVYNHAQLGELDPLTAAGVQVRLGQTPGMVGPGYNNDSTDDWINNALRPIPVLQPDGGMDLSVGVQDVAQNWYFTRRAVLLKRTPDPRETDAPPNDLDRFAHVLSPTDAAGNQHALLGFIPEPKPASASAVHSQWERHYLNWILGGEMDVVSPASSTGTVSTAFLAAAGSGLQDFVFEYEVQNRYFGGIGSLDRLVEDPDQDGIIDVRAGTVSTRSGGNYGLFRGPAPAYWLARSILDPEPPAVLAHRLSHYFLSNCASFKVEWTPNDIRLEQAGLPEVLWIDPFKEPGDTRFGPPADVYANLHPQSPITPAGVEKPHHLDEFEILAQKMSPESGVALAAHSVLGANGPFDADPLMPPSVGSPLHEVKQTLRARFGLSLLDPLNPSGPYVLNSQSNVFDADPRASASGVQPSYNTHSWYARDLELVTHPLTGAINRPQTQQSPDPMWPKALRITVDLFDDSDALETPIRHVFVVPVGARDDRKQMLD